MNQYLQLAVYWLPTILFVLFAFIGFLRGLRRGLRKSLILLIQAAASFAICVVLFNIFINDETVDAALLGTINSIMGENGLQNALGVEGSFTTLRQVLATYISGMLSSAGSNPVTAPDSGYIMALVLLAYHIVFAIILSVVYQLLKFIFYIIYLMFYSEGKYRRKKKKLESSGGSPYKKRKLAGSLVGLARGMVAGLVCVSLIGGTLSVITGGYGEGKMEDYSFGDSTADEVYSVYRGLDEYGSKGIIKVLNVVRDSDDVPYYLYITDLIFSGRLVDENLGIDEDIKFRDEFTGYIGFAKSVANLVIKYGGDAMKEIVSSENDDDLMAKVVVLFENDEFNADFRKLIEDFDAKTYISGFALSFIDAMVENIDDSSVSGDLDEDTVNIIKILFKSDYYSDKIPSDAALMASGKKAPVLKASSLISKKDILAAYDVLVEAINKEPGEEGYIDINNNNNDALGMLKIALPFVSNLSILSTDRASEVDPVLERLYTYVENTVLTDAEAVGYVRPTYYDDENIEWTKELKTLLSVANDALNVYSSVVPSDATIEPKTSGGDSGSEGKDGGSDDGQSADVLKIVASIFDAKDANYTQNMARIDRICAALSQSKLIGRTLSSSFMYMQIKNALGTVSSSFYMPDDIRYDSYGDNGGEIKALLDGLKSICKNETTIKLLTDTPDFFFFFHLKPYAEALTKADESGSAPIDCVVKSRLLHSTLSAILVDMSEGDDAQIYISDRAKETNANGLKVNIIQVDLLKDILHSAPDIVDLLSDINETGSFKVSGILSNQAIKKLTKNIIIQGTAAKLLLDSLKDNDMIVIPPSLSDPEKWLDSGVEGSDDFKKGEFRKIFDFISEAGFNIDGIIDGSVDVFDEITKLADENTQNAMLESELLWYSISSVISSALGDSGIEIIIPNGAMENIDETAGDAKTLIKKQEIKELINRVSLISSAFKNDETDTRETSDKLIELLVVNKDKVFGSLILDATIVNILANGDLLTSLGVVIPDSLKTAATKEKLAEYNLSSGWSGDTGELNKLLSAIDELFDISKTVEDGKKFVFAEVSVDATGIVKKLKNEDVLNTVYASEILQYTVSKKIADALTGDSLMDNPKAHESGDITKPYKITEIKALVSVLPDSGEINVSSITIDKLLTLYVKNGETVEEKSALLTAIISLNIRKVSGITVPDSVKGENVKRSSTDTVGVDMITVSEIYKVLNAIKALGINGLNDMNGDSFSYTALLGKLKDASGNVDSQKLDTVYASEILQYTVTDKVKNIVSTHDAICDSARAHVGGDIRNVYLKSEIATLLKLVPDADSFSVDSITVESLLDFYGESREDSALLTATISHNILLQTDIKVPSFAKESIPDYEGAFEKVTVIKAEEIFRLLSAAKALGITSTNELIGLKSRKITLTNNVIDFVSASDILRATVSANIRITSDSSTIDIYAKAEHFVADECGNVITAEQTKKLFDSVKIITGGEITVDNVKIDIKKLAALEEEDIDRALCSEIVVFVVSDRLDALGTEYPLVATKLPTKLERNTVYNLSSSSTSPEQRDYYTKEQCKAILMGIKSIIA